MGPPGLTQTDAKLPKTPKYKGAFCPQYDYYLPSKADFAPDRRVHLYRGDVQRLAEHPAAAAAGHSQSGRLDPLHLAGGEVRLAFGGSNLTNDRYVTAGSPNYGAGEVGGYYNPPLMWYASIRVKFKP